MYFCLGYLIKEFLGKRGKLTGRGGLYIYDQMNQYILEDFRNTNILCHKKIYYVFSWNHPFQKTKTLNMKIKCPRWIWDPLPSPPSVLLLVRAAEHRRQTSNFLLSLLWCVGCSLVAAKEMPHPEVWKMQGRQLRWEGRWVPAPWVPCQLHALPPPAWCAWGGCDFGSSVAVAAAAPDLGGDVKALM